jgi:predicted TPR repeat methyltransferase
VGNENDDPTPGLDAAYALETPDDNRRLYRAWADTYESDFVAGKQYIYHRGVAEIFRRAMSDPAKPVLDVGCGTGIVGEALRTLGLSTIDGIDISPEMLGQAAGKSDDQGPTYRHLIEADLTKTIDLADDVYAGVVSAGAFTHGHLGPDAIEELLRVAAPGARFALGINAAHFEQDGFADRFAADASSGRIGEYRVEDAIIYGGADPDDLDQVARVAVFTVT